MDKKSLVIGLLIGVGGLLIAGAASREGGADRYHLVQTQYHVFTNGAVTGTVNAPMMIDAQTGRTWIYTNETTGDAQAGTTLMEGWKPLNSELKTTVVPGK